MSKISKTPRPATLKANPVDYKHNSHHEYDHCLKALQLLSPVSRCLALRSIADALSERDVGEPLYKYTLFKLIFHTIINIIKSK
jgi:hypothetical protein